MIVFSLTAGVLSSVLASWGLNVIRAPQALQSEVRSTWDVSTGDILVSLRTYSRTGTTLYFAAATKESPQMRSLITADGVAAEFVPRPLRAQVLPWTHATRSLPQDGWDKVAVRASGIPFPSFYCVYEWIEDTTGAQEQIHTRGGIPTGSVVRQGHGAWMYPQAIPLYPIAWYALANALLYAAACYCALAGIKLAAARVRKYRGRCIGCGYSLMGVQLECCPECGLPFRRG